jgi:hypothetical protein
MHNSNTVSDAAAVARATSTPAGKENGSAASSPVVAAAPTVLSPQAWIPKIKEKKADRSIEDPDYMEAKAAWLSKMNAEFADVDSYALAEEPIVDGSAAGRAR